MMNISVFKQFYIVVFIGLQLSRFVSCQSTAKARGRRIAEDLWVKGRYSCANIESYRRTAERNLLDQCEEEFKVNKAFVAACKDGVEEVIVEKEKPCIFDTKECENYGESIGFGVAAQICQGPRGKGTVVFSKRCIRIATNVCIDVAINAIEDYLDEGTCAGKDRLTRGMEREVDELCTSEVKSFATLDRK